MSARVYRSGHCGVDRHGACSRDYGTAVCSCPCHAARAAAPGSTR